MVGPEGRHEAIGVVMNSRKEDVDVPRVYRRRLARLLYIVERHGLSALVKSGITKSDPRAYLGGKIEFAIYINPRNVVFRDRLDRVVLASNARRPFEQQDCSA